MHRIIYLDGRCSLGKTRGIATRGVVWREEEERTPVIANKSVVALG